MAEHRAVKVAGLFRSPAVRAVYSATSIAGGLVFLFGGADKWLSTASLTYIARAMDLLAAPHPGILRGWGVLLLVYGLTIALSRKWRPVAYAAGMGIWVVVALATLRTLGGHDPKNALFAVAAVQLIASNWLNMRLTQAALAGLGDLDRP